MIGRGRPTAMRAILLLASIAALATPAAADVLQVGNRVAELDVAQDSSGKPFKLATLKGKWFVVTVGADWCKPCAKELPTWDKLAGEIGGKVTFVAIDIDDEIDTGKRFHDKLKLKNMTRVYLPSSKSGVVARYGSDHMPTTYVVSPEGVVKLVKDGFETGDADGEKKKLHDQLDKLTGK
jgi:cytochrome oxidase Cu insertion factor (SCO1/SenC/PrrC family)